MNRTVDQASGFSQAVINVGRVNNKGIELALNGEPIRNAKGFGWSVNTTFSANKNTIKELADSAVVLRTGPVGNGQIVAKVGGSMGDMYGRGYLRAPDGQIVYDPATGFAKLSDNLVYLGNTMPKWKASMGHDFRYKQFGLHVLFDGQFGGVAYSLSITNWQNRVKQLSLYRVDITVLLVRVLSRMLMELIALMMLSHLILMVIIARIMVLTMQRAIPSQPTL